MSSSPSIRSRAASSTLLTTAGFGLSLLIRLASNIFLARLLPPSAFGLLSLIVTLFMGLAFFSDVGTRLVLIQHPRGHEPRFLATAFTIQVARGVLLFIAACLLAVPMARFYEAPELRWLIPFVSVTLLLQGFTAIGVILAGREMRVGRALIIDLASQILTSVVMIGWALHSPTPWSQAAGMVAGSVIFLLMSHWLLPTPGGTLRMAWDKTATRELLKFGKWTLVATGLTFLAMQADRLVLGKLTTMEMLGFYSIALSLALVPSDLLDRLTGTVIYPFICSLQRDGILRERFASVREPFVIVGLTMVAGLSFVAPLAVEVLYDARYAMVAPMMQIIAFSTSFRILEGSAGMALLANGNPRAHSVGFGAKLLAIPLFIWLGYETWGFKGAVGGLALAEVVRYLVGSGLARRLGLQIWRRDLPLIVLQCSLLTCSLAAPLLLPGVSALQTALLGGVASLASWAAVALRRIDPAVIRKLRGGL